MITVALMLLTTPSPWVGPGTKLWVENGYYRNPPEIRMAVGGGLLGLSQYTPIPQDVTLVGRRPGGLVVCRDPYGNFLLVREASLAWDQLFEVYPGRLSEVDANVPWSYGPP